MRLHPHSPQDLQLIGFFFVLLGKCSQWGWNRTNCSWCLCFVIQEWKIYILCSAQRIRSIFLVTGTMIYFALPPFNSCSSFLGHFKWSFLCHLTLKFPQLIKTEFLLTMLIQYQPDEWFEYQILWTNIIRNLWQTPRRTADEILGVKGWLLNIFSN